MHIDPLRLHHPNVLPTLWTIDIIPLPDGMITGDSRLPAVQQAALAYFLIAKELCPARGTVDGDHGYYTVCCSVLKE